MKAIMFEKTGGPEVMQLMDVDLATPKAGEVRMRHTAIGLNYIDTYHRSGLYPVPLPSGIGLEAAGVVEAVGEGVKGFKPGDRVAYGTGPIGAYAEARNIPRQPLHQDCPRRSRRDGGRHDAEGHDGALSPARHLQGEARARPSCFMPRPAASA